MRVIVVLAVALALSAGQAPSSFARQSTPIVVDENGQIVLPPGGGCVSLPGGGLYCQFGDAPKPSKPARPKPRPKP
jgi:hypothetical protein